MEKIRKILFLIGAAILLLVPMLTTNIKPDQVSDIDNRKLREFPSLQKAGVQRRLENYVSDRVGFRTEMITAYQEFCSIAFRKLVHPSYIYGKEGYIMVPWNLKTYQHLDFNKEHIEYYTDYLKSLEQFCQNQGMEFLFYLCPDKETIYPEFFPDGYNIKSQPNRTDHLLEKLDEKGVPYLFPKELFLSLKSDEQLYNVKYDAGHWNLTGAFYGHQQIISNLNQKFPKMGDLQQEEFEVVDKLVKYLSNSKIRIDDVIPRYNLVETAAVEDQEIFKKIIVTEPNYYHFYYKNPVALQKGAPKILIFGDSYFQESFCFYENHCSELMMLHAENMPDAEYYISVFQPDIVIYEVVERGLESERVSFTQTKRYYDLSSLQDSGKERGTPLTEQITPDIDVADLLSQSQNQKYVTISGTLTEAEAGDPANVLALAAIQNEKVYYSIFSQEDLTYQFTFQTEDLASNSNISFWILKEPTA